MNGRSLTAGKPWKLILFFAFPVLAGTLLQQLYNTVDTVVVGNFASEAALSAVGTTSSFSFLFLALAMGFSAGSGVIVAQHYGAGQEKKVRETASTGILLLMGMSVVGTITALAVCRPAFRYWLAVPEELLDMAVRYFAIYSLGLVFQYGYNIIAAVLRAVGDSKATLYFLLIASVLNIALDLLFVAVFHWGVAGAAVATDISQGVSFAAALIYMYKKYPVFRFHRNEWSWSGDIAKNTVKVGFPMAAQLVIVSLGFTFIQRAVNGYGKYMTASFTVAQRMETYMNMPATAFQTTLATYTGQNMGAGRTDRVKAGVRQTLVMSFLMTVCISALVLVFSPQISLMFGLSNQSVAYCTAHLRATAVCILILSLYMPIFGVFQGAGNGGAATLVASGALTTRVFCTYTLCNVPFFDYRIIWWNQLFGFAVGFTITWTHYLRGKWKNKSVISKRERTLKTAEKSLQHT